MDSENATVAPASTLHVESGHPTECGSSLPDDRRCLAVMYHYVRDFERLPSPGLPNVPNGIVGLSVKEFEAQLDDLCRRMEPIDWPTLHAWLFRGKPVPRRCFLLSFDDGLADHAETVLPILDRRGLRGVFFVPGLVLASRELLPAHALHLLLATLDVQTLAREVCDHLEAADLTKLLTPAERDTAGQIYHYESVERGRLKYLLAMKLPVARRDEMLRSLFTRHIGSPVRWARHWYLGWDDLVRMQSHGHTIGAHGFLHDPYSGMNARQRRDDLRRVGTLLREGLGPEVRPFSYPFGQFDDDACAACRAAGFAHGFTTRREWITGASGLFQLPRVDTIHVDETIREDSRCAPP